MGREAIGNITDFSEADIQIRGVYYPPGKEPGEGDERKLFLLITGQTELSVQKAKGEITRIIKEEFTRLQTSYQAPKSAASKWHKIRLLFILFNFTATITR